jgi:hypothetical protein
VSEAADATSVPFCTVLAVPFMLKPALVLLVSRSVPAPGAFVPVSLVIWRLTALASLPAVLCTSSIRTTLQANGATQKHSSAGEASCRNWSENWVGTSLPPARSVSKLESAIG